MGQTSYRIGTLPQINLSIRLNEAWKINSKMESRQLFISGVKDELDADVDIERLDVGIVLSRRTGGRSSLGAGYLARFEDGIVAHRVIQQLVFGTGHGNIAYAHRMVTDQTYRSTEPPEFRARYRLSMEIPLNGDSMDPQEFYVRSSNEVLGIRQSDDNDLEVRITGLLGYLLPTKNKLEVGLEYRGSGFIKNETDNQFWLMLIGTFNL
jgi:hypothetical protein